MKKQSLNFLVLILTLVLLIVSNSCQNENKKAPIDVNEIKEMMSEYRQAWRNGDSTLVLDKLSPDIILFQPGKTGKPIISKNEVRQFWFPESDIKYPILKYEIENEEIEGSGNIAYYQGTSKLTWCTVENGIARDTTLSISEFTNILKKEENKWKIYRIMYNLKDTIYSR